MTTSAEITSEHASVHARLPSELRGYDFGFNDETANAFTAIESGRKSVIVRSGVPENFKVGSVIPITLGDVHIVVTIVEVHHFNSLAELVSKVDNEKLLPGASRDNVMAYFSPFYSDEYVKLNNGLCSLSIVPVRASV